MAVNNVVQFPSIPGSPEHWTDGNPEVFFVAQEDRLRRCWSCKKMIQRGERYYGAFHLRLIRDRDGNVVDFRPTARVEMRLHPSCVREMMA
jgi:hypothetical protein